MENVLTVLFEVESEAYQAFSELRAHPAAATYTVAEAALLKKDGASIVIAESVDTGTRTTDDTLTGLLVGSIAGIIAGPMGVLLGAGYGALVGATVDAFDAGDDASVIEQVAGKLFDGEVAIIALVQEEEGSTLDELFAPYATTIIRHDAAVVADEVSLAREAERDAARVAREQMRAQRKAERREKVDGHRKAIRAKFAQIKDRSAERHAELKDNLDELLGRKADDEPVEPLVELEDDTLKGISGGKIDVEVSNTLTVTLDAYMKRCKSAGMTLDGILAQLSTLGLSTTELALAEKYVRNTYAHITL